MKKMNVEVENTSKKQTKRKRSMRNTIMMAGLSVVLLSGATYAWFTLSNTAKITTLSLGVAASSGLQIADGEDENGTVKTSGLDYSQNALEFNLADKDFTLKPAAIAKTGANAYSFQYDTQTDGNVTGMAAVGVGTGNVIKESSSANATGYYFEKVFYLRVNAGGDYDISLVKGSKSSALDGTYVVPAGTEDLLLSTANPRSIESAAAVRVAFYTGDHTIPDAVYEPNHGYTFTDTGNSAGISDTGYTAYTIFENDPDNSTKLFKQWSNGSFAATEGETVTDSDTLFTITGNADNKITMRVWIEGSDEQCVNEIAKLDSFTAQLKFKSTPQ